MDPAETYELLRTLTSPVTAVTSRRGGKLNGLISDAAIRASIVPEIPRVAVFIHKFNFSHDMVFETGRFAMHVLHTGQLDVVMKLGFESGRDTDKMARVPHRIGVTGCPVLDDCFAWFECEVVNVMDTGSSTCFLGEAVATGRGGGEPMMPSFLRSAIPEDVARNYVSKLEAAQEFARRRSRDIRAVVWRDLDQSRK